MIPFLGCDSRQEIIEIWIVLNTNEEPLFEEMLIRGGSHMYKAKCTRRMGKLFNRYQTRISKKVCTSEVWARSLETKCISEPPRLLLPVPTRKQTYYFGYTHTIQTDYWKLNKRSTSETNVRAVCIQVGGFEQSFLKPHPLRPVLIWLCLESNKRYIGLSKILFPVLSRRY